MRALEPATRIILIPDWLFADGERSPWPRIRKLLTHRARQHDRGRGGRHRNRRGRTKRGHR